MLQVSKKTLNIRGRLVDLSKPVVMGILNVTFDSFYEQSRVTSESEIIDKAAIMREQGALILDIGGYSTRPGAAVIDEQEETDRVLSAVEPLVREFPDLLISVDTFRSGVARQAVAAGAHIINDVSGGSLDDRMFETVAELRVPYILMHMRGTPETMNSLTQYQHLVSDILSDLQAKIIQLRRAGVADIIIDPGFGFAKTISQNFELMRHLNEFSLLGCPVLAGISRKKTIYKTLDTTAEHALNGTTVLNTLALEYGASILRVHDVRAAAEAVKLWSAVAAF